MTRAFATMPLPRHAAMLPPFSPCRCYAADIDVVDAYAISPLPDASYAPCRYATPTMALSALAADTLHAMLLYTTYSARRLLRAMRATAQELYAV